MQVGTKVVRNEIIYEITAVVSTKTTLKPVRVDWNPDVPAGDDVEWPTECLFKDFKILKKELPQLIDNAAIDARARQLLASQQSSAVVAYLFLALKAEAAPEIELAYQVRPRLLMVKEDVERGNLLLVPDADCLQRISQKSTGGGVKVGIRPSAPAPGMGPPFDKPRRLV